MFFYSEIDGIIPLTLFVNSSSLTFANTCIDDSNQKTFTITATAGNTTEIISISDDTDQYSFSPSTFNLSNGGSQNVTVTFAPTSWGVKTGSISISAARGSSANVDLSAVCVANPLIITSSVGSLNFQNTYINQTSSATFVVSAGGRVQDIVLLADDSDQFDFSPSSISMTGANQTQTVTVYFTPNSAGSKIGLLTLSASGGDVAHVSLTGSAVQRMTLSTNTDSVMFPYTYGTATTASIQVWGNSTGTTETVTITDNSLNFSATTSSVLVVGDGGNTKQTINLRFSPTTTGSLSGTLTLSSSGGNVKTVGLTGSSDQYYSSTSLLLRGNGTSGSTSIVDSSAAPSIVSVYGNTNISTGNSKYGGSSIYFDGNGDYLTVPDKLGLNFGSGAFTLEMWINPSGSGQKQLFGHRSSSTVFNSINATLNYNSGTGRYSVVFYGATSSSTWGINITTPATTILPNTWTHLAFVRNGNVWTVYINGTSAGSVTNASALYETGAPAFSIGSYAAANPTTSGYLGYIDDFKITKGVARYTGSFTPPGPV